MLVGDVDSRRFGRSNNCLVPPQIQHPQLLSQFEFVHEPSWNPYHKPSLAPQICLPAPPRRFVWNATDQVSDGSTKNAHAHPGHVGCLERSWRGGGAGMELSSWRFSGVEVYKSTRPPPIITQPDPLHRTDGKLGEKRKKKKTTMPSILQFASLSFPPPRLEECACFCLQFR